MKFQKVVGFGCSMVYGDELNPLTREQQCFIGRIGQHYNIPYENFGQCGASLQSTIWSYLWWLENEKMDTDQVLVIVGLTDGGRFSFYDPEYNVQPGEPECNKYIHSTWVASGDKTYSAEWIDIVKRVSTLTWCPELRALTHKMAVEFFDGQAIKRKNLLVQFASFPPLWPINLTRQMQASSLLWGDRGMTGILGEQNNHEQYFAKNGHPNEYGHELVANLLIKHIDSCIM